MTYATLVSAPARDDVPVNTMSYQSTVYTPSSSYPPAPSL